MKKVFQYDVKWHLLNEYKSITYASENTGVSLTGISQCCNGKREMAGGYYWSFENKVEGSK